jgi:hypothetical protein
VAQLRIDGDHAHDYLVTNGDDVLHSLHPHAGA